MKKYTKFLVVLFALMLCLTALCACGDNGDGGAENGGEASGDTIKIGVNYELSGNVATYGQSSVYGIELAIEEINEAGGILGKQVELVKMDNKSDSAEATTVSTKLVTQYGCVAILGPATSGNFKATIPVAESNSVPIISASATADDVTHSASETYAHVFRTCFSDSYQGVVMASFAAENLGAQSAVIIKDTSSDYAKGLAENFVANFPGTIVAEEGYVAGDTDFNAILTKIKDLDFDVIYLPGYYSEVGLIIKQARALGIDVPVLGADGFDSPTLLELAGAEALNDVYYTNHYSSIDEDPMVVNFQAAFKEKYNAVPDAFSAMGYDLGYFLKDAIERAGEANAAAITDALLATEGFTGVTGTITVDQDTHDAIKSIVVIGLKDGAEDSAVKIAAE